MTWKEKFYAAPQTTPWQAANCFSRWSLREHIRPFNLKTADGQTQDLRRGTADSHTTHANTKTTSSNETTERFSSTRPHHAKDITRWSSTKKKVTSVDTWTTNKHGRMYYARWTPPVRSLANPSRFQMLFLHGDAEITWGSLNSQNFLIPCRKFYFFYY